MKTYICKKCQNTIASNYREKHNLSCGSSLKANIKKKGMKLSKSQDLEVKKILKYCKKYQGEYLGYNHGPGSWATSYHDFFIAAVTDIYLIFESNLLTPPLDNLGEILKKNDIKSCRGCAISGKRLDYLFEKIKEELKNRDTLKKNENINYKPYYMDKIFN